MYIIKKTVKTLRGDFKIAQYKNDNGVVETDYLIRFYPVDKKFAITGKKRFNSILLAETYIYSLDICGFCRSDL